MADRWGFTFPLEGVPLPDHRQLFQDAERLGYTDAWTAEVESSDAFVPLALAAAWSDRLRLGSAIANVFTRGPALLALEAATVADAAPGRFVLGIGASSPAIVERWNGLTLERPLSRVRETISYLRQAFSGEKTALDGETIRARGFRLSRPPQQPPPIFVGALREKMVALGAGEGDGVITNWIAPGDAPRVVSVAKEAAKAAGKDPEKLEIACRVFVVTGENEEAARGLARFMITAYLTTPAYAAFHRWLGRGDLLRPMTEAWQAGERREALGLVPDEVVEDILVFGDRRTVRDKIQSYCDNGITLPIVNIVPVSLEPAGRAAMSVAAFESLTNP